MKEVPSRLIEEIWAKEIILSLKGYKTYLNVGQGFIYYINMLNKSVSSDCKDFKTTPKTNKSRIVVSLFRMFVLFSKVRVVNLACK